MIFFLIITIFDRSALIVKGLSQHSSRQQTLVFFFEAATQLGTEMFKVVSGGVKRGSFNSSVLPETE